MEGVCRRESGTHSEEQSRDGSAAFDVNHGQQTGEVALSGSGKEQPMRDATDKKKKNQKSESLPVKI